MIQSFGAEAIKTALYAHRKRMSKAQRRKKVKPVTNIYPWATEKRYAATIRAWLKPMFDFVNVYLKNNEEAILRGDSAALTRSDAIPGGSFRRMIASLSGWLVTYLPEVTSEGTRNNPPVVYVGLGKIAESLLEFSAKQWDKSAKSALGVEFPVTAKWWPDAKSAWAEENYKLIKSLASDYIGKVNLQTEMAITNGWSSRQLAKEIMKLNGVKQKQATLIARDQIGKLNGQTTQARMESMGLNLYEWSTSGDERVRDSHKKLQGKICKWNDPSVYSEDEGKTWQQRPMSWCQLHPGYDIQCRCTTLMYWQELVDEIDGQISSEE